MTQTRAIAFRTFKCLLSLALLAAILQISPALVRADSGETSPPSIAIGESHLCALTPAGKVLCWGDNQLGQVGSGTLGKQVGPSEVFGLEQVKAIAAGANHTCALLADGTVRCWGSNAEGQLGGGSAFSSATRMVVPIQVDGLAPVAEIALGGEHSCALTTAGEVFCWGLNARGQLGVETVSSESHKPEKRSIADAVQITAGRHHTCALTRAGEAYCWGDDLLGMTGGHSAKRVSIAGLKQIRRLFAGGDHTCAVDVSGRAGCWGSNLKGQLGNPIASGKHIYPRPVIGTDEYRTLALGSDHSCALLVNGTVKCWGTNAEGQLGIEGNLSHFIPENVSLEKVVQLVAGYDRTCMVQKRGRLVCWGKNLSSTPQPVGLPSPIRTGDAAALATSSRTVIAAGSKFTCAIAEDGRPYCWGGNEYGQLGDGGRPDPRQDPRPVSGLDGVRDLSAGPKHACALLDDGTVWCWGSNQFHQIASPPSGTSYATPVQISGLSEIVQISSNGSFACALTSRREVICWGNNSSHQLGAASPSANRGPYLSLPSPAVQVETGGHHACALTEAGTVWCWGYNEQGQLGTTGEKVSSSPVQVPGIENAIGLSAGYESTCALIDDGTVRCWGYNSFGQIGPERGISAPTPIPGLSDVTQIASGFFHACAIKTDRSIWCWGYNRNGSLGSGDTVDSPVPHQVTLPSGWTPVAIGAGAFSSFAVSGSGEVMSWGYNSSGNLASGDLTHPQPNPQRAILPFSVRVPGMSSSVPRVLPLKHGSGEFQMEARMTENSDERQDGQSTGQDARSEDSSERYDDVF